MNKTLTKITTQPLFELPEVRVVEASAGSGKTYALAKRYVQLLLNPALPLDQVPIRQVLAITFTNKASFEMKERILEFLKSIALGQMPAWQVEDMIKPLGISLPEARKKAYAVMEDIIRGYNFFQVQTIDKFINALLSGCAFKLGVTANFKIKTNVQEYLLYSLDQLIDQAADNKDLSGLFEEFLHHYLYLENRTGWFPKDDILSIISMLFSQNSSYGDDFVASVINSREIIKKKSIILADIKSLKEELPEGTDTRFLKSLEKFLKDHEKSFDVDSLSDYFARESVPVKKNTEVSNNLRGLWDKIRRGICQLCEQESASLFNPYLAIYQQTLNIFYQTASRDDVLFLNELNKRAAALFDEEQVTVEELYYRLATRFHHYLIDEFQDTSYLQWYNLRAMVEEGLSSGGSLFYVGDKKQAIYGFRGGEAALFEDVKAAFDAFNVKTEYLTKNWRSHKEIVDFNNMVFDMDNLRRFIEEKQNYEEQKKKKNPVVFHETDYGELGNVFGSARQSHREEYSKGYVRMEYVDIEKKAERDDYLRGKIIQLIKELKDRFHYKDIAILTRGNKEIEEITGWLLQENIQVDSERTSNVKENHLIVEIVSFLRFLSSPIDNVAFVDFIL
ncbi:MAG: UvrD-helicase domain-containing protein, partial [Candidatus Omnitrophica bacterium]|nr:UvrD-helicase domain-containing protein [Candidatus Omnitrophota bacterium]